MQRSGIPTQSLMYKWEWKFPFVSKSNSHFLFWNGFRKNSNSIQNGPSLPPPSSIPPTSVQTKSPPPPKKLPENMDPKKLEKGIQL
jgi:hypothetical protein